MRRLLLAAILLAGTGSGLWLVFRDDPYADVGPQAGVADHLGLTGEPLFVFGDLYLDGRSAWAQRLFEEDVRSAPPQPEGEVAVSVREDPFTDGDWLARLDEDGRTRRDAAETRVIESRLAFRVSGVRPGDLVLLLVAGEVGETADPGTRMAWYTTLPDGLPGRLAAGPGRYVFRRTTPGGGLRKATDAWYAGRLDRRGDRWLLREELWANASDDVLAVRLDVTQYVIAADGDGSRVSSRGLYRGQGFPGFLKGMAVSRTEKFYVGWIRTVREMARTWKPSEPVRRWARAAGL